MSTSNLNVDFVRTLLPSQVIATTSYSNALSMNQWLVAGITIKVSATSTPNFSVSLQVSNDGTDWFDYAGSAIAVTGNVSESYNIADFGFSWLRVKITRTGGSGTFEIKSFAKQG